MPRGSIFDEKEVDKIGEEGRRSATRRVVVSGLQAPVLGKKHVELFLGLYGS